MVVAVVPLGAAVGSEVLLYHLTVAFVMLPPIVRTSAALAVPAPSMMLAAARISLLIYFFILMSSFLYLMTTFRPPLM